MTSCVASLAVLAYSARHSGLTILPWGNCVRSFPFVEAEGRFVVYHICFIIYILIDTLTIVNNTVVNAIVQISHRHDHSVCLSICTVKCNCQLGCYCFYMFYLCVCTHEHLRRRKEALRLPGTGVTSSCGPPKMSTRD